MKKMILIDIKRNILSFYFISALILMIVSFLINFYFNILNLDSEGQGTIITFLKTTLFPINTLNITSPIIAVLAGGLNYYFSYSSGYVKQELMFNKKNYLFSKMLSSFISGFLVFFIGFLIIYLIVLSFDQSVSIKYSIDYYILAFRKIFETSLLGYSLIHILNYCILGGLFAIFGTAISTVFKNQFMIVIIPFLFYTLSSMITSSFGDILGLIVFILPNSTFMHFGLGIELIIKDFIVILLWGLVIGNIGFNKNKLSI